MRTTVERKTIRVFHFNQLTQEERDRLDADEGLWDSEPRFSRYADVTLGHSPRFLDAVRKAWDVGEYALAAIVQTDSPDAAYAKTAHVSEDWRKNDGVTAVGDESRSTTVGDVMIDCTGQAYVLMQPNYEEIDVVPFELGTSCDLVRDDNGKLKNARGPLNDEGELVAERSRGPKPTVLRRQKSETGDES